METRWCFWNNFPTISVPRDSASINLFFFLFLKAQFLISLGHCRQLFSSRTSFKFQEYPHPSETAGCQLAAYCFNNMVTLSYGLLSRILQGTTDWLTTWGPTHWLWDIELWNIKEFTSYNEGRWFCYSSSCSKSAFLHFLQHVCKCLNMCKSIKVLQVSHLEDSCQSLVWSIW